MGEGDRSPRPGEIALGFDPGARVSAGVVFIGIARTGWTPDDCPKNMREARATGRPARLEIAGPYRAGLAGLAPGMALQVLGWLDRSRRDLIVQAPRHREAPAGVFALRSPVRPNPLGLSCVLCTGLDAGAGVVELDALDLLDGTPILDIKPWIASVDAPPDAS
jgi:tRNA-Thr(GGU) m(6)t(6)A37 methyltransferase TsaA